MKKNLLALLALSLMVTACGPADTFTAAKLKTCADYFDYLYSDSEKQDGSGTAYGVKCEGTVSYQEDHQFQYTLILDVDGEEESIGLSLKDADSNNHLRAYDGQFVKLKGDLMAPRMAPNGAILSVSLEDIEVPREY